MYACGSLSGSICVSPQLSRLTGRTIACSHCFTPQYFHPQPQSPPPTPRHLHPHTPTTIHSPKVI